MLADSNTNIIRTAREREKSNHFPEDMSRRGKKKKLAFLK
jgi:hypothetical protein